MSRFLICGSPRTGGNLLCDLLTQAGIGKPGEWMNPDKVRPLLLEWKVPMSGYLHRLHEQKTYRGHFGCKVHWVERLWPQSMGIIQDFDDIVGPDGVYIFMRRNDLVAQAVSRHIAHTTGNWIDRTGGGTSARPTYHYAQISAFRDRVSKENNGWRAWFDEKGVVPHEVVFEEMVSDMDRVFRDVVDAIGAKQPAEMPAPRIHPQRGDWNKRFYQRFHEERSRRRAAGE